MNPSSMIPRRIDRARRWAALVALAIVFSLFGPQAARAQECGCTNVGPYKNPTRTAPVADDESPGGGTFRLQVSQWQNEVTLAVTRASTGATVKNFFIPLTRAAWGFSPDGNRFMFRYAFPETDPGSPQIDVIVLYDLVGNRQVHYTETRAGATVAFSPHGRWYLVNQLFGPNWSAITVVDAVTGQQALYEELIFEAPHGSPADAFGTVGLGFSSEVGDRSFVWAYRQIGGNIQLTMKNLESRATMLSTLVGGSAWWKFSPCGDALGFVNQTDQVAVTASVHRTATAGLLGPARTFSPVPDLLSFDTTLDYHRITTVAAGSGQSTTINVAPNTADTSCPPALSLDSVTLSPTTVIGGAANATGTVRLTAVPSGSTTVALSSSDTSAATVPASVTVAAGAQTATFPVTTKSVSTAKSATITATFGGTAKSASLSVTPATAPGVATVTINPDRLTGGSPATGTVTLDKAATAATAVILASNLPVASVPASVSVASGQSSATFAILTAATPIDTRVKITAAAGGKTAEATLSVLAADRSCNPGTSDPKTETLRARSFAAVDEGGPNVDCVTPMEFRNGITVGAGTTGLPVGAPVDLNVTLRFDGALYTSPPLGGGGALADGSSNYEIIEDSTPDTGEGYPLLVRFAASFELQHDPLYGTGPNAYESGRWSMWGNVSDPQDWRHDAEARLVTPATLVGDTGTLTTTYRTTVGAHLAIFGRVSTVASAYGSGSAAVADFSNTFQAATTPAPGYEGLSLIYDIGSEPVNLPPSCAAGAASTSVGTPVSAAVACTDPEGAALSFALTSGPAHGSVTTIGADGTFVYTPAAGYSGPDSFTFTATDGALQSAPATFAITVIGGGGPTDKDQCKSGGWQRFVNPTFRNQGDCVSFVSAKK